MAKLVLFQGIATLMGTIIGAGILGLPYVINQSGLLIGLIELVVLGLIILCVNLMMGEVMLRTEGNHQLPGYAKRYLGNSGKTIMLIGMIIGIYGPLLAYMIGTGEALHAIFPVFPPFVFSIVMFIILSTLVFLGLKAVEESEFGMMFIVVGIILCISVWALFTGRFEASFVQDFSLARFALPYGVIIFALIGMPALAEVREELEGKEKLLKKAIIFGSLIPMLLYSVQLVLNRLQESKHVDEENLQIVFRYTL
jgi:tyrosine-specific transport protein